MSRPNSEIDPASGASSPVIRLNSVVLPAPLGPMMRRRSPGSTARSMPLVTRRPPNAFVNPVTASAVMAVLQERVYASLSPPPLAGEGQGGGQSARTELVAGPPPRPSPASGGVGRSADAQTPKSGPN